MRRTIALTAVGALLAALTALTGTGTAVAQEGVHVQIIHGHPLPGGFPPSLPSADVDIYLNGVAVVEDLEPEESVTVSVASGTTDIKVVPAGGDPDTDALVDDEAVFATGTAYTLIYAPEGATVVGPPPGPVPTGEQVFVFANDLGSIDKGVCRFTFNHGATMANLAGEATVTIDGEGIEETEVFEGLAGGSGTVELPEGDYELTVNAGGQESTNPFRCVGGVHIVVSAIAPGEPGTDVFFLAQELPVPVTDVEAFCESLLGLNAIGGEVSDAIEAIGTADEPTQDEWRELFDRVDALLDAGDTARDPAVDDEWQTATSGLRTVRAALNLVDFDLSSPEGQQVAAELQAGAAEEASPESEAATDALIAYFVANCTEAPPPPAPPAAPVDTPTTPAAPVATAQPTFAG